MAYVLNGANGESNGFTFAIASFALRAMHESQGLVNMTNVVAPTQGNQFLVPNFAPITYQDYNPNGTGGTYGTGNATVQNPSLTQTNITATPAVAQTAFDIFYGWTTSFQLAATLGAELGDSFAEKVDQRVTLGFIGNGVTEGAVGSTTGFKATPTNTYYPTSADGFTRVLQLGALELLPSGANLNITGNIATGGVAGFTTNSVLELIRFAKQQFKVARMPGAPVIILDSNGYSTEAVVAPGGSGSSLTRLLSELTGGAVSGPSSGGSNLSALGNELLATGKIENIYGCMVMFTTFLQHTTRTIAGTASTPCLVGAYFGDSAMFTVMKQGLEIKIGEVPGGLQNWLTGVGYFNSGVGDQRRGGAINIQQDS